MFHIKVNTINRNKIPCLLQSQTFIHILDKSLSFNASYHTSALYGSLVWAPHARNSLCKVEGHPDSAGIQQLPKIWLANTCEAFYEYR